MTRLTEKGKYSEPYESKSATECINKLGKLEDLEEQLGCPLNVVINAMQNGFYDKDGNYYIDNEKISIKLELDSDGLNYAILSIFECVSYTPATYVVTENFWVSDYQTTWWLKKDKSE